MRQALVKPIVPSRVISASLSVVSPSHAGSYHHHSLPVPVAGSVQAARRSGARSVHEWWRVGGWCGRELGSGLTARRRPAWRRWRCPSAACRARGRAPSRRAPPGCNTPHTSHVYLLITLTTTSLQGAAKADTHHLALQQTMQLC